MVPEVVQQGLLPGVVSSIYSTPLAVDTKQGLSDTDEGAGSKTRAMTLADRCRHSSDVFLVLLVRSDEHRAMFGRVVEK